MVTGGYYLSSSTLRNSLLGLIHTFVLPSLLTEGESPPFSMFARRMVQYFHNAFVLKDLSDNDHLPCLSTIEGVHNLCALFVLAIFLNALDKRTYHLAHEIPNDNLDTLLQYQQKFDLNAIPVIERHQNCYTRGLAMDLSLWFFSRYDILDGNTEAAVDGHETVLFPFTAHIARQILRYHRTATQCGHTTIGTEEQVDKQVRSAILHIPGMNKAYDDELDAEREKGYNTDDSDGKSADSDLFDLDFDFSAFIVQEKQIDNHERHHIDDFFEQGKNITDRQFFTGLACQFDLNDSGNVLSLVLTCRLFFNNITIICRQCGRQ